MSFAFHRAIPLAAAAFCLACTDVSAQLARGSFEQALEVDAPVTLDVVTGSGSIDIRRGPPGQVRISGQISVGRQSFRSAEDAEEIVRRLESEPPIVVSGGRVSVGRIDDPDLRRNVSISYDITVPAETPTTSRTGSGNQSVQGLAGTIEAVTGSGDIRAEAVDGSVDLRTGSGSIDATDITGDVLARTGSGSVRLVQTGEGDVDVTTGSGRIEARGIDGTLRARAGSGSIEADGAQAGDWQLETGSGSVLVRLSSDASFDVDAHTGSGSIHIDHAVTLSGSIGRNSLTGRVGDGGPRLGLRTGSGSIRIEQQ